MVEISKASDYAWSGTYKHIINANSSQEAVNKVRRTLQADEKVINVYAKMTDWK